MQYDLLLLRNIFVYSSTYEKPNRGFSYYSGVQ